MIFDLKKFKTSKLKAKSYKLSRGMTYVELIVVLSIFAAISSVVLFNYGEFQERIDIKNLASDIALEAVEAQKAALSGRLPPLAQQSQTPSTWKPSYGIFMDRIADNKSFIYFTDLNAGDGLFDGSSCPGSNECLDKIIITKGNIISNLEVIPTPTSCTGVVSGNAVDNLGIVFKRPDSGARMSSGGVLLDNFTCVQITITSPRGSIARIKIYPSGRIQVN